MPNRWTAVAITAFWGVMMAWLLERDVLPQLKPHGRVDFRTVVAAEQSPEPVQWAILQGEDRVGTAVTEWVKHPDGSAEFRSGLEFKELPFGTTLAAPVPNTALRWQSHFYISPAGDLNHFEILLFWGEPKPTMTVRGKLDGEIMKIVFRSGAFVHEEQFYYEPRSLMMTSLAPIDKLPNLSVGKVWEHRVTNPIMAQTQTVRCEVIGERVINWRGDPVPTLVVQQTYGQMRAHCWVAYDGTVLRQEVPLGWNPLVLEHE